MRIKRITSQHRRDFNADYECEHCGFEFNAGGYDDANFHQNVVTKLKCKECGRIADDNYSPMGTKYPEGMTV